MENLTFTLALEATAATDSAEVHSAERVAFLLRQEILYGKLRPGAKLKDTHLSASYGVSRNTMRDAIRQLTADGLVVQRLHNGSMVRVLTEDDVRDIYRVRRVLEEAAIRASSQAPASQLRDVVACVDETARCVAAEDWDQVNTATMLYHQAIVRMLDSARTDAFFENILAQLRLSFGYIPDQGEFHVKWLERDQTIASLLMAGKREDACRELAFYLNDSEAQIIDLIRSGRQPH